MPHLQRTILLSFGGGAAQQLAERTSQRLQHPTIVTHLRDIDLVEPEHRNAVLAQTLLKISDAQAHQHLLEQGLYIHRRDEIAVWLLLNADKAWESDLDDVVAVLEKVAWEQLRSSIQITTLIWSQPYLLEETQSTIMAARSLSTSPKAIFLVSPVSESGLVLDEDVVVHRLAAALSAMLTSSLAETSLLLLAETPYFRKHFSEETGLDDEEFIPVTTTADDGPINLLSLGVNVYENPISKIIRTLTSGWVRNAITAIDRQFQESAGEPIEAPDDLLLPWQPQRLQEQITVELEAVLGAYRQEETSYFPGIFRLPGLVGDLRQSFDRQKGNMDIAANAGLTKAVAPMLVSWRQFLHSEENEVLQPAGGLRIASYRARLKAFQYRWLYWAEIHQRQLDEIAERENQFLEEKDAIEAQLAGMTEAMDLHTFSAILKLVVNPVRMMALVRNYLHIPELIRKHTQVLNRCFQFGTERLLRQMVWQYCLAAAEEVVERQRRLETLADKIHKARQMASSPAFLTDPLVTEKDMQRLQITLFLDEKVPLQHFLEKTQLQSWVAWDADDILHFLQVFAEKWLAPLRKWTATDVVAFVFQEDEQAIKRWFQNFFAGAPVFWPYHLPEPQAQSLLALVMPGDEGGRIRRVAAGNEQLQTLIQSSTSSPILAVRFRHLTTSDE